MYRHLLSQTVTLHTRVTGAEDVHGNPTVTYTDQTVKGLLSRQRTAEEHQGELITEAFHLNLEAGVPITGWDAITVDGVRYEVIGAPWNVWHPRLGEVHHVEADVRRA